MLEMLWNVFPGNLRGKLYDFVEKFGSFILNNIKLGRDTSSHVDAPLRKILKHQTEVDNNPRWLVTVSVLYDNFYWNRAVFFLAAGGMEELTVHIISSLCRMNLYFVWTIKL